MYDIVPTTAFVASQTRAALPVAGKFRMDEITVEHLVREAVAWGIPERVARSTVMMVLASIHSGLAVADDAVPQVDPRARETVLRQLGRLEGTSN